LDHELESDDVILVVAAADHLFGRPSNLVPTFGHHL
jgi:hypothetical protein